MEMDAQTGISLSEIHRTCSQSSNAIDFLTTYVILAKRPNVEVPYMKEVFHTLKFSSPMGVLVRTIE